MDFPRGEEVITEEQYEHNRKWEHRFRLYDYPAVYLTDASVNAYAKVIGYLGLTEYMDYLKRRYTGKYAFVKLKAKAAKASGLERARLLDELFSNEKIAVENPAAKMKKIIALVDNKDNLLRDKYRALNGGDRAMRGWVLAILQDKEKLTDREKLSKLLAIHKEYNYIRGGSLPLLINALSHQFVANGKLDNGVAFMDKIAMDRSYLMYIRQMATLKKGTITAGVDGGNAKQAIEFFEQAIAMDPDSDTGKLAKQMRQEQTL